MNKTPFWPIIGFLGIYFESKRAFTIPHALHGMNQLVSYNNIVLYTSTQDKARLERGNKIIYDQFNSISYHFLKTLVGLMTKGVRTKSFNI